MNRRFIYIALALFILTIGAFYVFRFFTNSTLIIELSDDTNVVSTMVQVDGVRVYPSGQNVVYVAAVGRGNHKIEVLAPGFNNYSTTVSTGIRSHKNIKVELTRITAHEVAKKVVVSVFANTEENFSIQDAKFFGNEDWLVFFVNSDPSTEGSIVVSRYSLNDKEWVLVDEGTDLNTTSSIYSEAPIDMLNYLRNY